MRTLYMYFNLNKDNLTKEQKNGKVIIAALN